MYVYFGHEIFLEWVAVIETWGPFVVVVKAMLRISHVLKTCIRN